MQWCKTDQAAIANFIFLLGDCHVNVQGCGPWPGSGVSGGVVGVCVSIGVASGVDIGVGPGVDIGVGARCCMSVCVCILVKHPDSIIEDETATAAW